VAQFEFLKPHSIKGTLSLADAGRIADHLRRGSLAILPTETGYMLTALATSVDAVAKAFAVKRRPMANVMHVACSSIAMVETVGVVTPVASRLLGELTPGPVSVIVNKTPLLPDSLVSVSGTVGIRVPDNAATLQIISETGAPLTATSLNSSGEPPIPLTQDALGSLNWPAGELVYVVEDPHAVIFDLPSTLVRVTGPEIEFLRDGPIDRQRILAIANHVA
jgi:L-threonylcarbamoyladenylate synthase